MSATSRGFRSGDTDDIVGTTRADATLPRETAFRRLVATDGGAAGATARLVLGLVMFPHAAQKVFGWFGGYGFQGTYTSFTTKLGLPGPLAGAVILTELLASIMLVLGVLTRVAAFGVMAIMIGAIVLVHAPNGFFMNWSGSQAGEGFEYHLLAIGLALVSVILGAGALSLDKALAKRRPAEGGSVVEPVTRD